MGCLFSTTNYSVLGTMLISGMIRDKTDQATKLDTRIGTNYLTIIGVASLS